MHMAASSTRTITHHATLELYQSSQIPLKYNKGQNWFSHTSRYSKMLLSVDKYRGNSEESVKSSVNKSTQSRINNCGYLLQHGEQRGKASPQIEKALSVLGIANWKSNLLCHTETCLTTLNNCTTALERIVFLLSNDGQGWVHRMVCMCARTVGVTGSILFMWTRTVYK